MPFLAIRNLSMHHQVTGRGPPVLLLHGLGSSVEDWEYQLPALAPHHRVIAADMRGHGRTRGPAGPYSVSMFASDTAALLERLEPGPVHVVGISMGGMIGLQLALDHPARVRSLVVVNAGPRLDFDTAGDRLRLALRLALVRIAGMRVVGRKLAREMFPEPGQQEFRHKVRTRWARCDRRCYLASIRALLGWDVRHRLCEITCPVLVVRGVLDQTPMDITGRHLARMPHARRVVVEGSRHATVIDRAEEFNRLLLGFLADP